MTLSMNAAIHSSSVTLRKPSRRGVTAPTLLTRMSSRPRPAAASIKWAGPSAVARSVATKSTRPVRANQVSSGEERRAPATTATPSSTSTSVTASPMPLLAPVTIATRPARPSSTRSELLIRQPAEYRLGDVAPAAVNGQGVPPPLELPELSDRRGPLLLISGLEDHTVPDVVTRSTLKQYRSSTAITELSDRRRAAV